MELSGESAESATQKAESTQTSAELVMRARLGDAAAWEDLVRLHQEPVFRLAYLLLGDADEAEDVAQETFIRAFRALERFDLSRPLRPWLLSISANLARNRLRSFGRFFRVQQRMVLEHSSVIEDTNRHEQRWQSHALWAAVMHLSQSDQQIIYLRYFLDMSVDETAQALDVPGGTVKSRLHRALERLRLVIEQEYTELKDIWA